jgi:hypothetical protein
MLRVFINLAIWIAVAELLPAQTTPVDTTICDIAVHPQDFDGKAVRLRATVLAGFEVFAIRDPQNDCANIWLSFAGGGPEASLSFGAQTPAMVRPELPLTRDRRFRQFVGLLDAEMYPRERGHLCIACKRYEVTATMIGRIDVAPEGRGFGHLNGYPLQFVLQRITAISTRDLAANYDSKLFSAEKVRFPTGYLIGKVIGPEGKPIEGTDVTAISTEDVPLFMKEFSESTDEKGRFEIGVPPGSYIIGVNINSPASPAYPYATTFSPGTTDKDSAARVTVAARARITVPIRIKSTLVQRKYPVKVTWPDGKPVQDANVWLEEQDNPKMVVGDAVSHTDSDGRYDLRGFQGISYLVKANIYVKPTYTPYCAPTLLIKASDTVSEPIQMILTNTGEMCRGNY